jgi:hypothetical protein
LASRNVTPRIRGARTPGPSGVVVGRKARGGLGDLQFLNIKDLAGIGVASQAYVKANSGASGFGFYEGGTMTAGELIGVGTWGHPVTFAMTDVRSSANAGHASTSTAVFDIYGNVGGFPTLIGTITFSAGNPVGVVAFSAPFTLATGQQLSVVAPATADASLADVRAVVYATS